MNGISSLRAVGELQNNAIRERHWLQLVQATKVDSSHPLLEMQGRSLKNILHHHLSALKCAPGAIHHERRHAALRLAQPQPSQL